MNHHANQNEELENQLPSFTYHDGNPSNDINFNNNMPNNGVPVLYNHQSTISINSIQSLVEPITPPSISQKNEKFKHQKAQSLDMTTLNQPVGIVDKIGQFAAQPELYSNDNNYNGNINKFGIMNTKSVGNPVLGLGFPLPMINEFGTINDNKANLLPKGSIPIGRQYSKPNTQISHKNRYSENNKKMTKTTSAPQSSALNASNYPSISELSSLPLEKLDYVTLATDQFGCRFLQKKLESPEESTIVRDFLYEQVKSLFLDLILDPFGNYLIQKLCDYLTLEQRTYLIKSIYPHVFQISINQYGTRSLQKIIDTVDNDSQIDLIIKGFSNECTSIDQVVTLINDLNGNHVIQKCIFKFPTTKFDFIVDAIVNENNIVLISTHKHGCCVLQKLLGVSTLQQIFKLSVKIIEYLHYLINDQFGNYIIQFLLDIKELDFYLLSEIYNKLIKDIRRLACSKFSSNVIEKFIKKLFRTLIELIRQDQSNTIKPTSKELIQVCIDIILSITDSFTMNLNGLIADKYGNYTLQTLLDVKNYIPLLRYPKNNNYILDETYETFSIEFNEKINNLICLTKNVLPSIKTTSYAKKIKLKVKAFSELQEISLTDITQRELNQNNESKVDEPGILKQKQTKRKIHGRNYSLPGDMHSAVIGSTYSSNNDQMYYPTVASPYSAINLNHSQSSSSKANKYPILKDNLGYNFGNIDESSNVLEFGLQSLSLNHRNQNQHMHPQSLLPQQRLSIFSTEEPLSGKGVESNQLDSSLNGINYPSLNPVLHNYYNLPSTPLIPMDKNLLPQTSVNSSFQKNGEFGKADFALKSDPSLIRMNKDFSGKDDFGPNFRYDFINDENSDFNFN